MIPIVCQSHYGTEYSSSRFEVLCETIVQHAVKRMIMFYGEQFGGHYAIHSYGEFEDAYVDEHGAPLRYRWFHDGVWHDSTADTELCEIMVDQYNYLVMHYLDSPTIKRGQKMVADMKQKLVEEDTCPSVLLMGNM